MTLRLHDTASRQIRDFVPLRPGRCGIYLCGATVQAGPHLGHLRSAVNYDVLYRWLSRSGYEVTFVRNVTDIDDKILARSAESGVLWWALAYANERAFADGYALLGCLPPTLAPRATGHIPEMVELMHRLIDTGHAYAVGGDVYFDVRSHPNYGALSGQRLDNMQPAADADPAAVKKDPRDFALWKAHKAGEPETAAWATPWGSGRPGWHLECSAMAGRYLGDTFDIHGGGQDLIFPHHENEIAQSEAAGRGFARYWVHHALLNLGTEKMSKSLGNVIDLPHVLSLVRPVELRYYLVAPHYRSVIDYSAEALTEAGQAFRRIENFLVRAAERLGSDVSQPPAAFAATAPPAAFAATAPPAAFAAAMDDDLGTPAAVAVVHEYVRLGNAALSGGAPAELDAAYGAVRGMLDVLGLDPSAPEWQGSGPASDLHGVVDALVAVALEQRQAARARKDYAAADAVRDRLMKAGITVEDTAAGSRWTLSD